MGTTSSGIFTCVICGGKEFSKCVIRGVTWYTCMECDSQYTASELMEARRRARNSVEASRKTVSKNTTRSNMFANLENTFKGYTTQEITQTTTEAYRAFFVTANDIFDDKTAFMISLMAARLGVASKNGRLNFKEKTLANKLYIADGNSEEELEELIYNTIAKKITDDDYELVKLITKSGNDLALPFLYIVLGFAYIDGTVDDEVMSKLDPIFGINLVALFAESGLESVPTPQIQLTALEENIVNWLRSDNTVRSLQDIVAHFPGKYNFQIEEALDSLCDKGIVYKVDTVLGDMYGLI